MSQYYIIVGGNQFGPYPKEELLSNGLTPSTPVWREGMADWQPAERLPELADLFMASEDSAFGGYAQPEPQAPQYRTYAPGQNYNNNSPMRPHTNWLPWAIVGTIIGMCSCFGLIFGIIGIVYSSKANNAFAAGDEIEGNSSNQTAKTMTILSLVFGGLSLIGNLIYILIYGATFLATLGAL